VAQSADAGSSKDSVLRDVRVRIPPAAHLFTLRSLRDVEAVQAALNAGLNAVEAGRATGVPWRTIQKWRQAGIEEIVERRRGVDCDGAKCDRVSNVSPVAYSYLLGQYLGDGSIASFPRGVFRLQVYSDLRYPGIIDEVLGAMAVVMPTSTVWIGQKTGCAIVSSYSKHWPCLFPQHAPGPKHLRRIELMSWQRAIVEQHPKEMLRGLIHSDGCRVLNVGYGTPYPRYHFTNHSSDIREIFLWVCSLLGVECRPNSQYNLSIARRASVARVDEFVGPKV
jgi:hypothetical protein